MSRLVSALFSLTVAATVAGVIAVGSAQGVHGMWHKDPMVTAGHPLYAAKQAAETGVETLAPNASVEARATLTHADRRVSEVEQLAGDDQPQHVTVTAERYSATVQDATALGDRISDLAQRQAVNALIANATIQHRDTLQTVLDQVPDAARAAVRNASTAASHGHDRAARRVAAALQEQARQRLDDGNDRLDAGNHTAAEQAFTDAETMLRSAEQWLTDANSTAAADLRANITDTRAAAATMQDAVDAAMAGDTDAAADHRGRAREQLP